MSEASLANNVCCGNSVPWTKVSPCFYTDVTSRRENFTISILTDSDQVFSIDTFSEELCSNVFVGHKSQHMSNDNLMHQPILSSGFCFVFFPWKLASFLLNTQVNTQLTPSWEEGKGCPGNHLGDSVGIICFTRGLLTVSGTVMSSKPIPISGAWSVFKISKLKCSIPGLQMRSLKFTNWGISVISWEWRGI